MMATEWNAEAGGNYCWPEMAAQAEALLDYLADERIGLVAWALDTPNLREADGSYTTLNDLVCGERRRRPRRRRADDPRIFSGALNPMAAPPVTLVTRGDASRRPSPRSRRRPFRERILVDDASTDGSRALAQVLAAEDPRVRLTEGEVESRRWGPSAGVEPARRK